MKSRISLRISCIYFMGERVAREGDFVQWEDVTVGGGGGKMGSRPRLHEGRLCARTTGGGVSWGRLGGNSLGSGPLTVSLLMCTLHTH